MHCQKHYVFFLASTTCDEEGIMRISSAGIAVAMALGFVFFSAGFSQAGFLKDLGKTVTGKNKAKELDKEVKQQEAEINRLNQEVERLKKENAALEETVKNPPPVIFPDTEYEVYLAVPELNDGDREPLVSGNSLNPWQLIIDFRTTHWINSLQLSAIKKIPSTDITVYAYDEIDELWRTVDRAVLSRNETKINFSNPVQTDRLKLAPGGNVKNLLDLSINHLTVEGWRGMPGEGKTK